jgi:hypothetical protein
MSAVSVADNPVLVGSSTVGQVTISGPAPSGGQPVSLQSTTPSPQVTVPASVVVAADQTTATFPVGTATGAPPTTTLTAAIGSSSKQVQLNVVNAPSVSSVALERQCFTGPGSFPSNRVTLNVQAPADIAVNLSSNNASFPVPSTVTVPKDSKIGLFSVTALVPIVSPVMVTATLGGSVSDSASLYTALTYPALSVSDLSLDPSSVTPGDSSIGTITLNCEPLSGPAAVTVTSSDPSVATVVSPVNVPQGQLSKSFDINVVGVGTTTITATGPSGGPQQATLTVTDLAT